MRWLYDILLVVLSLSIPPLGWSSDLLSTSTSTDANSIVTFSMRYASMPEFNLTPTGQLPDGFRVTLYDNGTPVSIIKGYEMYYGYGLPIHYIDDPEPLVAGRWKGAVRYALSPPPENTLTYSAHIILLGVSNSQFTYKVEQYNSGLLAKSFGCQSEATCEPTSAVAVVPPPDPTPAPAPPTTTTEPQTAPVSEPSVPCQSRLGLWFANEKGDTMSIAKLARVAIGSILTIAPVLLTACSDGGGGGGTGTTPQAPQATAQYSYVVKFTSGDINCVIENANAKDIAVFRTDASGTTEVPIQTCH